MSYEAILVIVDPLLKLLDIHTHTTYSGSVFEAELVAIKKFVILF